MMLRTFLFTLATFWAVASGAVAADWKLVWADEFNYQGLPDPTSGITKSVLFATTKANTTPKRVWKTLASRMVIW